MQIFAAGLLEFLRLLDGHYALKSNIYVDSEVDLSVNQIFKPFFAGIHKKTKKKLQFDPHGHDTMH